MPQFRQKIKKEDFFSCYCSPSSTMFVCLLSFAEKFQILKSQQIIKRRINVS